MSKNDDHIGQEAEDPSRTLDSTKPMYELGSRIGCYKLLSVLGEGGSLSASTPLIADLLRKHIRRSNENETEVPKTNPTGRPWHTCEA